MRRAAVVAAVSVCLTVTFAARAAEGEFKSDKECIVGAKVADRQGRIGTVTSVASSTCHVALEDGSKTSYLFWMLRPAGAGAAPASAELPVGTYKCHALSGTTLNYLFMDVRIDGPTAYADSNGRAGTYRLEASQKIVFESGPFAGANAQRLSAEKIGINLDGGSFFNTTCGRS